MAKTKTSLKQKKSMPKLKKTTKKTVPYLQELKPKDYLLDKNFIGSAILECLNNNDPEGVIEIINIYLNTLIHKSCTLSQIEIKARLICSGMEKSHD